MNGELPAEAGIEKLGGLYLSYSDIWNFFFFCNTKFTNCVNIKFIIM